MATAIPKPSGPTAISPQITHPLDQLRGTIRRYVVVEGLLSAGIFAAAWLVVGLLLDYGLFKSATWDWALDGPWWLRFAALLLSLLLLVAILLERDVLLWDTPWPRRAHLELVRFPDEGLKVAKDAPPPRVQVRAYRWVVADRSAPMGWRPMVWSDVTEELLGGSVPYMAPSLAR